MNIPDYIDAWNAKVDSLLTIQKLADEIGYTRSHLVCVINGVKNPGPKLRKKLYDASLGEITAEDLMQPYRERRAAARREIGGASTRLCELKF